MQRRGGARIERLVLRETRNARLQSPGSLSSRPRLRRDAPRLPHDRPGSLARPTAHGARPDRRPALDALDRPGVRRASASGGHAPAPLPRADGARTRSRSPTSPARVLSGAATGADAGLVMPPARLGPTAVIAVANAMATVVEPHAAALVASGGLRVDFVPRLRDAAKALEAVADSRAVQRQQALWGNCTGKGGAAAGVSSTMKVGNGIAASE